jgi:transposase, IS30 family
VEFCPQAGPQAREEIAMNKNTNGLLRQYFPKGTDLKTFSRTDLSAVARELNGRPRQRLGWMKPSEVFGRTVASTA